MPPVEPRRDVLALLKKLSPPPPMLMLLVIGMKEEEELEDEGAKEAEEEIEATPPWRLYCSDKLSGCKKVCKSYFRRI